MERDYVEILIGNIESERADIIIALLAEEGFEGFEQDRNNLKAYISNAEFSENYLARFIEENSDLEIKKNIIPKQNFNAAWEADFKPVQVDDFAYIRAEFHAAKSGIVHDIIITPKMSFGTGHHPTTYLMVKMMQSLDFSNKTVFDFGTGTGVLAILAEKMGALNVNAIDVDEWSITNAHENVMANHCVRINIFQASKIEENHRADIILANITFNVIRDNIKDIVNCCGIEAEIIFSGLLKQDENSFVIFLKENNLAVLSVAEKDGWIAVHAKYSLAGSQIINIS